MDAQSLSRLIWHELAGSTNGKMPLAAQKKLAGGLDGHHQAVLATIAMGTGNHLLAKWLLEQGVGPAPVTDEWQKVLPKPWRQFAGMGEAHAIHVLAAEPAASPGGEDMRLLTLSIMKENAKTWLSHINTPCSQGTPLALAVASEWKQKTPKWGEAFQKALMEAGARADGGEAALFLGAIPPPGPLSGKNGFTLLRRVVGWARPTEDAAARLWVAACKANRETGSILRRILMELGVPGAGKKLSRREASPLAAAIGNSGPETVSILLAQGADPAWRDERGETLLHVAMMSGDSALAACDMLPGEVVRELIDTRTLGGWTPLHIACKARSPKMVEWLLARGADPNVPGPGGRGAMLSMGVRGERGKKAFSSIARQLLAAGYVPVDPPKGPSHLHLAGRTLDGELCRMLLEKGCKGDRTDHHGLNPLDRALLRLDDGKHHAPAPRGVGGNRVKQAGRHLDEKLANIVRVLAQAGISPGGKDANGNTSLHRAVAVLFIHTAEALIDAGVDPTQINLARKSPSNLDWIDLYQKLRGTWSTTRVPEEWREPVLGLAMMMARKGFPLTTMDGAGRLLFSQWQDQPGFRETVLAAELSEKLPEGHGVKRARM